ncbi:MAG: hypothetical protein WBO97_11175 [Tepidiformaceae bacterium]
MSEIKRREGVSTTLCRHHWVIETPNGSVSSGRCKTCGIDKEFRNSAEEPMWDNDSFSLNGSRFRGRRAASNS